MMSKPTIALTRKELYRRVWSKPLSLVAREVGLSGNALAKICNRLLVPYPSRGYWSKSTAGKEIDRPPLPKAPESNAKRIVISAERASSRRSRTRLDPSARRDQLVRIAEALVLENGMHAATMKRIAARAGISETLAYNYFSSREHLFAELARREFGRIREARLVGTDTSRDYHYRVVRVTRAYLREIGQHGVLLQRLLSSPDVRSLLRAEHRENMHNDVHANAQALVDAYGIPRTLALGTTVVLTAMCLRAGKIIADGGISVEAAERLCLSMVLQGSRDLIT